MSIRLWGATVCSAVLLGVASAVSAPVAGIAAAAPAPAPAVSARYTDTAVIGAVPTFGAISGIDRIGANRFAMISTDVGRAGPARFFTSQFNYSSAMGGFTSEPGIDGGGLILGPGNLPPLPGSAQYEGIRRTAGGYVVVSGGDHQFVHLQGPGGTYVGDLALPPAWIPGKKSGLAGQLGLTGAAVGPDGQISVLTAGGLRQDPSGSARLLTFGGPKRPNLEYVYRTDPGQVAADVLAINNTDFLVLERGRGRTTEIFWATTRGADQIGGRKALGGRERAMGKRLLFTAASTPMLDTGNMSGLAWGNWQPDLPWANTRARTLFVVTNNAFAGPTRVHSFEVQLPR
ncbi:esterase-like activity of phytase family protein [Gordonia sp. NPDC003429]